MRSQDVYDRVKVALQELATANKYFLLDPITEEGQTVDTFPMITMEPGITPSGHGPRGREFTVEIDVQFAVRSLPENVVDELHAIESAVKTKLFNDPFLSDNTKFFDFAVDARDFRRGTSATAVGWAECTLSCIVTDKEDVDT